MQHIAPLERSNGAPPAMESGILLGLAEIGAEFNREARTIKRWVETEGFPAAQLPNGEWISTRGLIETWIMARVQQQRKASDAV